MLQIEALQKNKKSFLEEAWKFASKKFVNAKPNLEFLTSEVLLLFSKKSIHVRFAGSPVKWEEFGRNFQVPTYTLVIYLVTKF